MTIPQIIGLADFSHGLTVKFKARADDKDINDAGQAFLQQLAEFRDVCGGGPVVLCLDRGPYWRKTVYPGYKEGREREPEYAAIYTWTLDRARKDGYQIASAQGEEGDDVIATLATTYEAAGCNDVRIFGADKDTCQVLSSSVRMFVPKGRGEFEIRGPEYVTTRYGVAPHQMALFQAICGDPSDKIPGIKGIGDKGAAKLITAYGTPAAMAEACVGAANAAKMSDKPVAAFWRNYATGMAELPKWLQLTTLNRAVAFEVDPITFLERLPVQPLVETEPVEEIQDEEFPDEDNMTPQQAEQEADWDRVARETAAREAAELAAQQAVPISPPPKPPIIGKDPNAETFLQEAAARRADGIPADQTTTHYDKAAERKANAEWADREMPLPPMVGSVAPKAQAPSAATGAAEPSPPAAAAASVVPKTQGPRKVDAIPDESAIVPVPAPSWNLAVQPRTANEMLAVAKTMINSRYFSTFGTPEGVFAVMALGRELGLGMAQALQGFFIVQGRPFASSAMLRALVQKHPDCAYFVCRHSDDKSATFELRRKSWPEGMTSSLTYTWDQAVAAKLTTGVNKENWVTKPTEMISKTAAAKLARREFADATFGLHTESEVV